MVMGVPSVESPPVSPKGGDANGEDHSEEPTFVLNRGASRKKLDEAEEEKRWDERIRKATTPRAQSGGAAAANGFALDTNPNSTSSNSTSSLDHPRTPTKGGGGGSRTPTSKGSASGSIGRKGSRRNNDNDNDDSDSGHDNNSNNNDDNKENSVDDTSNSRHNRKGSRRGSKVMFDTTPLGPTPAGASHERRSSLKPPGSDSRLPERRGSRQGTPFPTIDIDGTSGRHSSGHASDDSDDEGGLRGKRKIDDDERGRVGGGGGNSTRARDAPSTPAFRRDDDDDFFDRKATVTAAFEQAIDVRFTHLGTEMIY
jgi:hypothetical protein